MHTLILGGTKGLGRCLAELHSARGDTVYCVGRSAADVSLPGVVPLPCDLDSPAQVMQLVSRLRDLPVDRYFWVAGALLKGAFAEQDAHAIGHTLNVNLHAGLQVAQAVWRQFVQAGTPKYFVTVASSSGLTPRQDEAVYVATKHAQVGFTRSLGLENRNPQVHVTLVLPGGMRTGFWDAHPHAVTDAFLDPAKVARRIADHIATHTTPFAELDVPRGSL